jgi:hypothetical protein
MKARFLVVAALMMGTVSCGYSIKSTTATTDYDTKVDFSNYHTFFIIKGNSSGNRIVDDQLISSVQNVLTEKGWLEVPEGEGRAAVVVHTATKTNHTYRTFYEGWGGWHWAGPGSAGFAEDYQVGTVVVTIFDAETKRAIWRGFATDAPSDSSQREAKTTEKTVVKIFKSLPRATIAHTEARTSTLPARDEPPAIIFSTSPARLIVIDGDPIYRPVPRTELQRIVNTRPLVVCDVAGMYYLKILDGWMETYSLDSDSWAAAGMPPDGGRVAVMQAVTSGAVDLLDGVDPKNPTGTPSLASGRPPAIYISTRPAELIVTNGPMVFAPIQGTSLEYAVNTTADVFREPTDHELYLLTSGRWLRSWRTEGPWQFVASRDLPADFARIPDSTPQAKVKASIAGGRH